MATYVNQSKNLSNTFLLLENGNKLLLENGDDIILSEEGLTFTNQTKNSSTFTNFIKSGMVEYDEATLTYDSSTTTYNASLSTDIWANQTKS